MMDISPMGPKESSGVLILCPPSGCCSPSFSFVPLPGDEANQAYATFHWSAVFTPVDSCASPANIAT